MDHPRPPAPSRPAGRTSAGRTTRGVPQGIGRVALRPAGQVPRAACERQARTRTPRPPAGRAAPSSSRPSPDTGAVALIGHDLTMPERQRRVVRYGVLMTTRIRISALFLVRPEVSEVEDHR